MIRLNKNEIYDVRIDGYSSEGQGVGRIDGQVIFVKGGIKGELCRVKVLKATKNLAYGKIESVLEPSEHRIEPKCPVYGKCGGCHTLHMDYEEEIGFKKQRVHDALLRIGGVDMELSVIGAGDRKGYRNKAIYNVGDGVYGFYRQHSHDIVDAGACFIQNNAASKAASAVKRWMKDFGIPAYNEETQSGNVRRIFCRYGEVTGELQVTLVTFADRLKHTDELIGYIKDACPEIKSIIQNVNKTTGNTVLSGEFKTLWGTDQIEDVLCGLRFSLSPLSFYQVNHDQAERLYGVARDYAGLTGAETVIDLYCGTGTITLYMAEKAKRALGVEIVEPAIRDAKKNALKNGVTNAEFICADAGEIAAKLEKDGIHPDVVVVDPPRKGLAPGVPAYIAGMSPKRVVYVSCDPETLARDIKRFGELGYAPERATVVDLFPGTYHVETIVLLQRETS